MSQAKKRSLFSRIKASYTSSNVVMSELNPALLGSQQKTSDETSITARDENDEAPVNVDLSQISIHQVAREGDVQTMVKLLDRISSNQQRKKKVNQKDDTKLAPLHYAARYSNYKIMRILIENGANVRLLGDDDATPLHFLAKYKKKSLEPSTEIVPFDDEDLVDDESNNCIRLLLSNGADVNAREMVGLTPLHQACARNNVRMVRELLQFPSTQLEVVDNQGMTALHLSCLYGREVMVKLLLEAGALLRCRDKDLTTPFHLSCAEGSLQIAHILLDKANEIARSSAEEEHVFQTIDENSKVPDNDKQIKINTSDSDQLEKKINNSLGLNSQPSHGAIDLLQDRDVGKNIPLHLAIENGHLTLTKLCVEEGKKAGYLDMVKACRSQNDSCLHLAVQSNSLEIVIFLLKEGIDVNFKNMFLTTPLMVGCYQNAYHIVEHLLQNGANLEFKNSDYMTSLMIACKYGHYDTIQCLLQHGANVTETDKDDKTCLMFAAEENRTEALSLLLENKVMDNMVEEKDKFNNTALHLASMKGHQETVKLLLDHRASADTKNEDDRTTLHMAALYGHEVIIPDLISKDRAIINSGDEESNTALHLAAIGGNLKSVTSLVQSGANMEILNAKQWRPLDAAAANGWEKIVLVLLESGTYIEPRGKIKVSPLHLACQRGHVNVVKILLQWKADVTFKSSDGRNALDFAIDFGQKDCVLALIKHETWQQSMKNAVINPVTGRMTTPMRKLIMKMGDLAMIVCDQCISDNGKKPENDSYAVTLSYDLLDDSYASAMWLEKTKEKMGVIPESNYSPDDSQFTVYDENDELTLDARSYTEETDILHRNHPLHIMVASGSESLLLHPVVTGLLNHKWRSVGRYIYYINLLLFIAYLLILNCYMLLQPPYYRLDWVKIIEFRSFLSNNRSATGLNLTDDYIEEFKNDSPECWYYRTEVVDDSPYYNVYSNCCTILPPSVRNLRWFLYGFAVFHIMKECIQLVNKKFAYFELTNLVEVTLYVLSFLLPLQFSTYTFSRLDQLTAGNLTGDDVGPLVGFQQDTGLRQEWQQQIGAFSVFLSWMVLLLFIRKVPRLGLFVVMFTDILGTFSQFFVVFAFFILAFALSFTILLGNQHEFEIWYEALLKTTVMMIGELDYASIFYSTSGSIEDIGRHYHNQVYPREITFILFFIFLLVVTIIIMNLLVGLAVGDIIQVRQNATLETVGMQVALILDIEFTLPSFLRKKFFRRKQRIEPNKYRHSNVIKKFFLQDKEFLKRIAEALGDEEKEQDEPKSAEDKVMSGLNLLRVRISDVLAEQADLRQDVRGVRSLVRQSQLDAKSQADSLQDNIKETNSNLTTRIDSTRSGLAETTQVESLQTRHKVDGTNTAVNMVKEDLIRTKESISVIKSDLEKKIEDLHHDIVSKGWKEVEVRIQECNGKVEETKKEVMGALDELKLLLVKEKYMTRV